MHWNRWYAARSHLQSALWLSPLVAMVLAQATFRVPHTLGMDLGWIPGFEFTEAGSTSAMEIGITLNLSFIVFAFSSLLVALQVASAQLTPRIIATTLLRDNVIRVTVGLFAYGLVIATGTRNRMETVPHVVVSVSAVWGVVSVVAFLFLIDYAARLLRPVTIVWRVGEHGLRVIHAVYPDPADRPRSSLVAVPEPTGSARAVLHAGTSAVVIAVNTAALVAAARRADGIVELVPQVGDFVAAGEPLFRLHGGAVALNDRFLRRQVAFGPERTIEQDSTFAFRVVVDVAVKALSKAINDPTTAVVAIDQLQRLLRVVGGRQLRGETIADAEGRPRLILRTPNWEDFVRLACSEIRLYGAENFQVARRLRAMMEHLLAALPEHRHPALLRELALLDRTIEASYAIAEDQELARVPDRQGLGGSSRAAGDAHTARSEAPADAPEGRRTGVA